MNGYKMLYGNNGLESQNNFFISFGLLRLSFSSRDLKVDKLKMIHTELVFRNNLIIRLMLKIEHA